MEILGTVSSLSSALPSALFFFVIADLRGTFNVLHGLKFRKRCIKNVPVRVRKYPVEIYIIYIAIILAEAV